jgi:glycosyltransferase involved in cell wall biosynthesis
MKLSVLSVAYPLAPVGPDAAGGSEQILTLLDRRLARAGHQSVVIAPEGSQVEGTLLATPWPQGPLDERARQRARRNHRRAIEQALEMAHFDLVHMHSLDFHEYLPAPGVPVLATLHLPPDWYPPGIFWLKRPQTWLHCVSQSQQRGCPRSKILLPPVENGVPLELLGTRVRKRDFAIALGRICPEKGFHKALDACIAAGTPMVLAGEIFRYEAHERYFWDELLPRLDGVMRHFIGPVGFARKRRLLAAARCLLVPSLVQETSSLVAMEALACGTPVIAFPSGALAEIVEHGKTGFLVETVGEMAEAIRAAGALDPERCRQAARERFSAERMLKRYLKLYERLAAGRTPGYAPTSLRPWLQSSPASSTTFRPSS